MENGKAELSEQLLERLIAMLKAELGDDLLGVLVTGSRIYGNPDPTSDLDVHIIIKPGRRRRRNTILDGIEIEMFFNPHFQMRRYFIDEAGHDQHMFTFGRAIYDPHGIVAELQTEARALWQAGPPIIHEHEVWQHRYRPADWLRDLEDVGANDEATSSFLIAKIVETLLVSHYRINHRWPAKAKRRLLELERWDPTAAHLTRFALEHHSLAETRTALERLAAHILAPIGGLMPLEWSSDWEELQP